MRPHLLRGSRKRVTAAAASAVVVGALCIYGVTSAGLASASTPAHHHHGASDSCHLAHGITHVIELGFDNVHFFRDNPNVPSDLEQIPSLLNFIEGNGVMLSNNHTPLIAHTSNDLLTTWTGMYGDRHGVGIGNTYRSYDSAGTTDLDDAFTYWTDPIYTESSTTPSATHDTNPNMVYSPVPPATAKNPVSPTTVTPAPWVQYTRAGCNVGEVATVNQEIENPAVDIPLIFGPNSPEEQQLKADADAAPYYDNEVRDYEGLAIHCAKGAALCANAEAVKYGQTTPSHDAVPDLLPDEPGGYNGYQALFGSKYIAPLLGQGTPNLTHDGVPVTDSAGYLTDEFGNEIDEPYASAPQAGFPTYDLSAAQSLSYTADMLENGVQVVDLYMEDIHDNQDMPNTPDVPTMQADCENAPGALPSGSQCYEDQARAYNEAFTIFFQRLAADGITPKNTLFVFSQDEGDHEAGANVGRALQPTPAGCDGVTTICNYAAGSFGELDGNMTGLLKQEENISTPFTMENDTAPEFYLNGNPGSDAPVVRTFERAVGNLTADDPYAGNANEKLTEYLANPQEEAILHMVDADPARTPTLAMFANPDYYFESGSPNCTASGLGTSDKSPNCVYQTTDYMWDHGDYAAEINTNWVGFVGPGVRHLGLDGPAANAGTTSSGPDSGLITVSDDHFKGPWVDETDIQPTIMYLLGLHDPYVPDGRVITQILQHPNNALDHSQVTRLGECYKQLNSSVGQFGAATLIASTNALESNSSGDATYLSVEAGLKKLEIVRDHLAIRIKDELTDAAFYDRPIHHVRAQIAACEGVIRAAKNLANNS
jgi:hypothetical protein